MADDYLISAEQILKQENFRTKLVNLLKSKGVEVEDEQKLNDSILEKINNLLSLNEFKEFIDNNVSEFINTDLTYIGDYGLFRKTKITKLWLPNVKTCGYQAFVGVPTKVAYFPNLESGMQGNQFDNNEYIVLPKMVNTSGYGLIASNNVNTHFIAPNWVGNSYGNSDAKALELMDVKKDGFSRLTNSKNLNTIIIRLERVATLSASSYLNNSGVLINIYVTQELIEDYKNATNWSVLYNSNKIDFLPLETSKYVNEDWYKNEDWFTQYMRDLGVDY